VKPGRQRRTTQWKGVVIWDSLHSSVCVYLQISTRCHLSTKLKPHLSRRWEHLHARALQIRAELSTHIHRESGPQRPTHSVWSFLFEKTKLQCGKKPPAFRQRQAHNAVRHAARSRPARSAPGHRARTRASYAHTHSLAEGLTHRD